MKIHHLNCGTMCPRASRLVAGSSGKLVCHCLLIETNQGLVLIDTGFGTQDIASRRARLGGTIGLSGPVLDTKETAIEQVRALGFRPSDVRHIVLTHLDLDHAGGLSDFPWAKVHCHRREHELATDPRRTIISNQRYRPAQWAHGPDWQLYDATSGEGWFGFRAVKSLEGLPPEILLIPLEGHTLGHCGVAVSAESGWLLHAGDAYFHYREMQHPPRSTLVLSAFQRVIAMNNRLRRENLARLRKLAQDDGEDVHVFCAHDFIEFSQARALQSVRNFESGLAGSPAAAPLSRSHTPSP